MLRPLLGILALSAMFTLRPIAAAEDIKTIAVDAYVYGYSLVTMEYTRRVMTNTESVEGTHAPMGQFVRMRAYPNAQFRDVTAPNADTLYSTAWLDLAAEPYVLNLPDMGDRYFLMPMLSGWTDVFQVPGTRTTGNKAQSYLITGPGWKGDVPAGMQPLAAPTNLVWILGRTYCTGTPEDYKACHAVMDQYDLRPLSAVGKAYTPPKGKKDTGIDMNTPVREQVHALNGKAFFTLLATLMKNNPANKGDEAMLEKLAKIGLVPGQAWNESKLDAETKLAIAAAPAAGQAKIMGHLKDSGELVNGWTFSTRTGLYGTDYLQRAFITAIGLGANRPQDAVYPTSVQDALGKKYSGANRYVMHFEKGQTPPVDAFWSLTMYDAQYFFVDNPLNRFNVSRRNALRYNTDGSLDLYIQHESPGAEKESNWLPAPKGEFVLMLRMYWPKEKSPSIIDGTWKIPAVKMVP